MYLISLLINAIANITDILWNPCHACNIIVDQYKASLKPTGFPANFIYVHTYLCKARTPIIILTWFVCCF